MNGHLKMMAAAWGLALALCGLTTNSAQAVPTAGEGSVSAAKTAAPQYKVKVAKLCQTKGIRGRELRCKSGYSNSAGKLQYYQAKIEADERIFDAQTSSCTSLTLAFWGDSQQRFSASLTTTGGTKTVTSKNTETKTLTGSFRGPFRVSTTDEGGGSLYLTGYAMCSTPDGLR